MPRDFKRNDGWLKKNAREKLHTLFAPITVQLLPSSWFGQAKYDDDSLLKSAPVQAITSSGP